MAISAPATVLDEDRNRAGDYARVVRRNRMVGVLRIVVPAAGAIVLAVLGLRATIGTALPQFEFARVSVDRDALTVEVPVFSGTGEDGSVYAVRADSARTALGDPERLDLRRPSLQLTQSGGIGFAAVAEAALLDLAAQSVAIEGVMRVTSTSGLEGTLRNSRIEVATERLETAGGVNLRFGEFATIAAETMRYDGATRQWSFENPVVVLAGLPGSDGSSAPDGGQPADGAP